jgi:hypothetical protein
MPKIHIELKPHLKQRLVVKAGYLQMDYTEYVAHLIEKDTGDVVIPKQYQAKE